MSYASDYANAVSRIYESSANARAEATRQNGALWGNALTGIGQLVAGLPEQRARQQEAQLRLQLGQGQLEDAQRARAAQSAFDGAMQHGLTQQPDGTFAPNRDLVRQELIGKGFAHTLPPLEKSWAESDKLALDAREARQKVSKAESDDVAAMSTRGLTLLDSGVDPGDVAGALLPDIAAHTANGVIEPAHGHAITAQLGAVKDNPQGLRTLLQSWQQASKEQMDAVKAKADAASATAEAKNRALTAEGIPAENAKKAAEAAVAQQVAAGTVGGVTPEQQITNRNTDALRRIEQGNLDVARTRERREGAAAAVGQTMVGANVPEVPAGQKNEAFLKTLPEGIAAQVKALDEGRMAFPTGSALRAQYWQNMLEAVSKYDRSFDAVNYNARSKTRGAFTSGPESKQVNAINTVIGHLDSLSQAADALGNTNYPLLNSVTNMISKGTGSPKVTNFNTVKKAVSDEVTRVWRQSGGTEADIQSAQANLDAANSPDQLHQAIATYGELLESKLGALQTQYQQGMGMSDVQMVTPAARATLTKLEKKAGKAPASAATTGHADPLGLFGK